ncbi:MAG: helix-turn-helix domain-containing protein, partial [Gammaproteobacteria bacterium]
MASEVGGEQRCGTGARLRDAREKQGLTLAQAAESLHLDPRTLEALEAEDFAALGADVYVRGHLRRYAELIGESPAQLQELYARSAPAAHPDLTRIPHREPGRGAARLVRGSL